MIKTEYNTNKQLNNRTKYDIQFDRICVLNKLCADYIYDLLQDSVEFNIPYETQFKLLSMIENILGHKIDYEIISESDRNKIYIQSVPEDFNVSATTVQQLHSEINITRDLKYNATLNNEKIVYAYPSYYGDIISITDLNSFDIKDSFRKEYITIHGIEYTVYTLIDAAFVNNYEITFA